MQIDPGTNMRDCPRCKGTGITVQEAFSYGEHSYPREEKPCYACDGAKQYPEPSLEELWPLIRNPKTGKLFSTSLHAKAGRKRAEYLTKCLYGAIIRRRAQYVWRMALWNSGQDRRGYNLGGAIMANMDLCRDPWKAELDAMADQVADQCYGQGANMRAAVRWNKALHGY